MISEVQLHLSLVAAAATALNNDADDELLCILAGEELERSKKGSLRRMRSSFEVVTSNMKGVDCSTPDKKRLILKKVANFSTHNLYQASKEGGNIIQVQATFLICMQIVNIVVTKVTAFNTK